MPKFLLMVNITRKSQLAWLLFDLSIFLRFKLSRRNYRYSHNPGDFLHNPAFSLRPVMVHVVLGQPFC